MRHLLYLFLIFLLATPYVFAAKPESVIKPFISVYPVIFNIAMQPGKTTMHEIIVTNLLDSPLPIHSSLESFNLSDNDYGEKPPPSFSAWAQVDQPDMILAPGESKKIHVRVSLPKKIALGGYYANLNLEPKLLTTNIITDTHIQPQIEILFLGSVGVPSITNKIGAIEEFTFPVVSNEKTIHTTFKVKNISLYHFSAKPQFKIKPLIGAVQEKLVEEKLVLPGRARSWEIASLSLDANYNIYKVQLQISVGNGVKIMAKRYIIVFPYKKFLLTLGVLLLSISILKKRKQVAKALTILVSNKKI